MRASRLSTPDIAGKMLPADWFDLFLPRSFTPSVDRGEAPKNAGTGLGVLVEASQKDFNWVTCSAIL